MANNIFPISDLNSLHFISSTVTSLSSYLSSGLRSSIEISGFALRDLLTITQLA